MTGPASNAPTDPQDAHAHEALWQGVPFAAEIIRRVGPRRVLEVTSGRGRWAALIRAFLPSGAEVEIHAIETRPGSIPPRSRAVYDAVHAGEVGAALEGDGRWHLIVLDGVLGPMGAAEGVALVRRLLERSAYVLADIPLGEPLPARRTAVIRSAGSPVSWCEADLSGLPSPARTRVPDVKTGRPIGVYLFSAGDPRGVGRRHQEWGADAIEWGDHVAPGDDLEAALRRVEEMAFELAYIKGYSTYRWANRLRNTPAWNALRWAHNRNREVIRLRVVEGRARVRRASARAGHPGVPWDFVERGPGWSLAHEPGASYEQALVGSGWLRIPAGPDPAIEVAGPGRVEVVFADRRETLALGEAPVVWRPAAGGVRPAPAVAPTANGHAAAPAAERSEAQRSFVERVAASGGGVVAVHCPRWLGITSSTRTLFNELYPIPEEREREPFLYGEDEIEQHARVLLDSGARHLVFSGGDTMHFRVMELVKRARPEVRCDMLWHASFVQFLEDYNWHNLRSWIDAARAGLVHTIGVVKAGMESFLESQGVRSRLVLNLVPGEVQAPPELDERPLHVGMWLSNPTYRKIPHAMLSAIAMVRGAKIHAAGLDARSVEVIEYFDIPKGFVHKGPIPHAELMERMRQTHLSLYVTFSECCPMVPLESLAQGVPCLTGPNSHLFEDDAYLFERLVVPFPDRADVIARMIGRAAGERHEIVARYRDYAVGYNERARASVAAFLGEG